MLVFLYSLTKSSFLNDDYGSVGAWFICLSHMNVFWDYLQHLYINESN